jgi:phenylacetate-CoA ligase
MAVLGSWAVDLKETQFWGMPCSRASFRQLSMQLPALASIDQRVRPKAAPGPKFDHNGAVRALAPKLARTELMPAHELEAFRAPLLSQFLAHARHSTQYYRDRLDFNVCSLDEIRKQWLQIPILTRAEAVASREKLISENMPDEFGAIADGQTSGSTGMPLQYRTNAGFKAANCALTERMFRWWRVDGNKSFAQIIHAPLESKGAPSRHGTTFQGWHTARPRGMKYSLSHIFDIDTQLQWLLARQPAYFASFSGIIRELAAISKERGFVIKFALVFSGAAVVDPETRSLCRAAFGAEIADTYGAQEAGHIAAQCPHCGEYHVSGDMSIIEILRDDGSPAESGEIGRVVVTPMHNYAMPLIRYELGDYAEVGTKNPRCGRTLPTLRRILGRYRNLFRFRDGTRIWPVATRFFLHEFMSLRQFQIVQTDFGHIEIRYVPCGEAKPVDLISLTNRVRAVLGQPVKITVHPVEKIERSSTGKFEDCISLVPGE